MMSTTKMKLRLRKKSASGSVSEAMSAEASPDSKCPICLDRFKNMAYLDFCLHRFCFRCIHEWSKNKAECPLCKQPFNSIFHSIKAENDFKKYDLRPTENGSFGSLGGQRFRYRTTLTGDRRPAPRRTSPPPDNGVIFEGLTGSDPQRQDRGLHRMMMRLAARRSAESEGRATRSLREQEMVKFRRALYRRGVQVRSVRDGGRYRDMSAEFFQRNPACLHRLLPWLKRELAVLYGSHGSLVNIVQHIIMSQITRYDMEDQAIRHELRPFLQARTEHFLHEFVSFARSPFNMEAYDQHAVYDCPAPPSSEEGGSSDSSVIAISEDESDSVELDPQTPMAGGTLSQTPWDDETPGPSYSTEPTRSLTLSVRDSETDSSVEEEARESVAESHHNTSDTAAQKREPASPSQDDCVIVGYVKPMAERTPELVQLSSNSEESECEETSEISPLPQHIRFSPGLSTPSSVCSSSSKHTSAHRLRQSPSRSEGKEKDQTSSEVKALSPEGSPSAGRHTASRMTVSKNHRHEERDGRRHYTRDCPRERSRSRSRARSSLSIRRPSRSRSKDHQSSKEGTQERRRDKDGSRVRRSHSTTPHSYHWHSYSHYSCERDSSKRLYSENRSSYTSCYLSPDHRTHPGSRSQSRESHRRDRSRSRSRSSTNSHGSHRKSRHDKPSGKRKYKTRHLEEPPADSASKPDESTEVCFEEEKKKSKERRHKRSWEKSSKKSRSPSVEIVYESMEKSTDLARRHHKKKKKHKKKSKRHKSREQTGKHTPTIITIDSDSDHATGAADLTGPTCSNNNIVYPTTTPLNDAADTSLLESILQDWEQQIPPVNPVSASGVLNDESSLVGKD